MVSDNEDDENENWKLGVSLNQIVGRMWPGHSTDTVTLTYS